MSKIEAIIIYCDKLKKSVQISRDCVSYELVSFYGIWHVQATCKCKCGDKHEMKLADVYNPADY